MLLCLKSYATYFGSQKTFSPILTCRWKLPCAFKIKKDAEPCQCTVAGHSHPALVQKWWWQGIYKPFTLARNPQGSNHSLSTEETFVCRPVSLFKGQCQGQVYGQPCSEPSKVQMRKWRLFLWLTGIFLSCGTCFLSLVPMRSGRCGSPHAPGCAYSMQSTSPCFWCLQLWVKFGVNNVDANIAKGSVPWLNDHGFTVGFVFLFFSCIVAASAGRESRGVLYQMDLSPIFGICDVLIILLFYLGNKAQPNHPLWLYIKFKRDVSDKLFSECRMV